MIVKNSLKLIPLVLSLSCLSANAARTALTIFLDSPAGAPESAVLVSEKGSLEVTLPKRNLSQEFDLPGGDLLLAALQSHPKEGEAPPKDTPTVRIPESWNRCILLFFPDPSNDTFPVRIIPVNATQAVFPLGKTLVFNLSDAKLIASFGGQKVSIPSSEQGIIEAPIKEFGSYPVAIDFLPENSETPLAVCRTTWQHDPESRQILFVVPGGKVPRIWGVMDRPMETP